MTVCQSYDDDHLHLHYAKGPSLESGREFHTFHEILYIPEIDGRLITEGGEFALADGCLLLIPRERFHHLILHHPEGYTRFCFHFEQLGGLEKITEACMREVCVIEKPGERIVSLFGRLPDILAEAEDDKRILIQAVFSEILVYLKKDLNRRIEVRPYGSDSAVCRALTFIGRNYRGPIDLHMIADSVGMSPSSLSHMFKTALNTSVYQYITNKRMITAQRFLSAGVSPTATADACGYSDYTVFYRAYKKYYGVSPAQAKRKGTLPDSGKD